MNANINHKTAMCRTSTCAALTTPLPYRMTRGVGHGAIVELITMLALAGLLLFVLPTKPALSQGVQLVKVDVSVVAKGYRASQLVGSSVSNDKNEKVGSIDDIIVDKNKVLFAVLQVGGFLGLGKHLVALPFDSLQIDETGKKIVLPGASKEQLKNLAEFKYST